METSSNATHNGTRDAVLNNILPHFIITDVLMYVVSSSVLLVNGGIVLIFLAQHVLKPSATRLSPAGVLVLNLLVSDALVGVLGIYMTASYSHEMVSSPYGCAHRMALRYLFRMGSHMALINVAIDRYVAIMYTLRYREWVTIERSLALIAVGWIIPMMGAAYVFIANDWQSEVMFCGQIKSLRIFLSYIRLPSHIAALLCVIVIQCRVYIQLRKHEKTASSQANQVLKKYSRKSARALFWVTSTYVICWLPFDVLLLLLIFMPTRSTKIIFDGSIILAHSSFLVNATIFSYKTENIRKPVSVFCSRIRRAVTCRKPVTPSTSVSRPNIQTIGPLRQSSSDTSNTTVTTLDSQWKQSADSAVHI